MRSAIDRFISNFVTRRPSRENFGGHYEDWRNRRIAAIINYYGRDFFGGKTLLELGCGHGDIGLKLRRLGARVTFSDARSSHLDVLRTQCSESDVVVADLDAEWPFTRHYDIIIHMGVLYHLKNYESSLQKACASCQHLVLETEVCDSDDPDYEIFIEEEGYDQAFNHVGCRPSPARIERILAECGMNYSRVIDSRCNADFHQYDWPVRNTRTYRNGLRRMWFAIHPPLPDTGAA